MLCIWRERQGKSRNAAQKGKKIDKEVGFLLHSQPTSSTPQYVDHARVLYRYVIVPRDQSHRSPLALEVICILGPKDLSMNPLSLKLGNRENSSG